MEGEAGGLVVTPDSGTIYVGAGGTIYAFNHNGEVKWTGTAGTEGSSPVIAPLAASRNGTVYAYADNELLAVGPGLGT